MDIFTKIVEFKRDKQKSCVLTMTYRVKDSDLLELSERAAKMKEGLEKIDFLLLGAIDFYNREGDLLMIKHWFNDNPLMIFGVDIVLDNPLYNKTFNY